MPARTPTRRRLSASIAAIERHKGSDDPRLPALRAELHVVGVEETINAIVSGLTPPQRAHIAWLLLGGEGGAAA